MEYGSRSFEVRDAGSCTASASAEIPLENVPRLEIRFSSGVACPSAEGTIELSAVGGFGDYSYSVDDGEMQDSPRFDGLPLGEHFFLLRDGSGCEVSAVGTMEQENVLTASAIEIKGAPCESAPLGEVELSASGGSGVYSYRVDGGEARNSARFVGLALGERVFEVSDGVCTVSLSTVVPVENPPLLAAEIVRNVSCESSTAGEIELFASGGSGIYSYGVDGGETQSSPRFDGLGFGQHVFELSDGVCTASLSTNIVVENPVGLSVRSTRNVPCETAVVGRAEVSAVGGSGIYSYGVDGGETQSSPRFDGLGFGEHIFEAVDGEGCRAEARMETAVENPVAAAIVDFRDVPCETANTGFVRLEASGGLGGYLYGVDDGEPGKSPLLENLGYGRHVFFVADSSGCRASTEREIGVADPVKLSVKELGGVPCPEARTGFVALEASGGSGRYLYSSDGGRPSDVPRFEGLTHAKYFFSVLDASGCEARATGEIPIENPPEIVVAETGTLPCPSARTAFVEVRASGGSGLYLFGIDGEEPQESNRFEGLGYGEHRIAAYESSGCRAFARCFVDTENPLRLSIIASGSTACKEGLTGFFEVEASGGAGEYAYSVDGGEFGPSPRIERLGYGYHTIDARDRAGCRETVEGFVPTVDPLELKIINKGDAPCENLETGFFEVEASGGSSGKYLYRMDEGEFGESNLLYGAGCGKHSLSVSDGAGCECRIEGEILAENELSYRVVSVKNVICDNSGRGALTLEVFGGVGEYVYGCDGGEPQNNPVFEGLDGGVHEITAVDARGCALTIRETVYNTGDMKVEVEETTPVPCLDAHTGTARVSVVGGDGKHLFRVDGGEWRESPFFEGLAAGLRKIEATDEGGCIASTVANIVEKNDLRLEILSAEPVHCPESHAGTIRAKASGGTAPYEYGIGIGNQEWRSEALFRGLPKGRYKILARDSRGCRTETETEIESRDNPTLTVASADDAACAVSKSGKLELAADGGAGEPYLFRIDRGEWTSRNRFSGLAAGRHVAETRDREGCNASIEVTTGTKNDLTVSVESMTEVPCATAKSGEMSLRAAGGAGEPYLFRMNGGRWSDESKFYGLAAGTHLLAVRDGDGCTASDEAKLGASNGPRIETIEISGTPCPDAKGGYFRVEASGGAGEPYRYRIDGRPWGNEPLFEDLKAGNYVVKVADALDCTAETSIALNADLPPPLAVATVENVSCRGGSDGKIEVEASGGIPPYEYLWNDERARGNQPEGLPAGNYGLTLIDRVGCKTTTNAVVKQPDEPLSAEARVEPLCRGRTTGKVFVEAKGGSPPYLYRTEGNTYENPELVVEGPGIKKIEVRDRAGCRCEFETEIEINDANPEVNFLVASGEQATDTLVLKEICLPEADGIEWVFDRDTQVIRYGESPLIRFAKPGTYKVKLIAWYGGCRFETEKVLNVVPFDPSYVRNFNDEKSGIRALEAFPNPAAGGFTARVKLGAKQKLRVQLFSIQGALVIDESYATDFFEKFLNPRTGPGIYVLKITTQNDQKECVVVIH